MHSLVEPDMPYKKIPLDVSIHLRYWYQDKGETISELVKRYPAYPRTSISRHAKKPIGNAKPDGRVGNTTAGRKSKLSERDVRRLESSLHKLRDEVGPMHSTLIEEDAGFKFENISNRTIRRALNKKGYDFTQCRKKGQNAKNFQMNFGLVESRSTSMVPVGYTKPTLVKL